MEIVGIGAGIIENLEEQVRCYPSNSNDYFFWEELGTLVA